MQVEKLPVSRFQCFWILLDLSNQVCELLPRNRVSAEKQRKRLICDRANQLHPALSGAAVAAASISARPLRKASSFALPKPRSRLRKV